MSATRFVLVTGVAGSGKTTIATRLAARLGWPCFEGDDFHTPASREKMARGVPLDDLDRAPWLAALRARMDRIRAEGGTGVFTCSALRQQHRQLLLGGVDDVLLVYLAGEFDTVLRRVAARRGHYFKSDLVRSQFEALEAPVDALTVDIEQEPDAMVEQIVRALA